MHINEKVYYALQLQIVVMMELVVFTILTQNYSVVKILTTWEMYYNVAASEMYYDFDITVVDFNEFVLSFLYQVDKMRFLRLGRGLLKVICWSSKNATTTNGAWN